MPDAAREEAGAMAKSLLAYLPPRAATPGRGGARQEARQAAEPSGVGRADAPQRPSAP
jgi:hypothetical protein